MNIKCFLIEPTGRTMVFARRYTSAKKPEFNCPNHGYHNAMSLHEIVEGQVNGDHPSADQMLTMNFPTHCDCGYAFNPHDEWQVFPESEYHRTDNGELTTIQKSGVGAIWRAPWFEECKEYTGKDGKSYVCRTPGGEWMIDSRAANCTLPEDNNHKCWCRHGEVPNFTVDKIGDTCQAGAGSILMGMYHGFLINGELTNC